MLNVSKVRKVGRQMGKDLTDFVYLFRDVCWANSSPCCSYADFRGPTAGPRPRRAEKSARAAEAARGAAEEAAGRKRAADVKCAGKHLHQGAECAPSCHAEAHEKSRGRYHLSCISRLCRLVPFSLRVATVLITPPFSRCFYDK